MKPSIPTTVIALSGFKRSGKDSVAEFMSTYIYGIKENVHVSILPMAESIRSVVGTLFSVYPDQITDKEEVISSLEHIDIPVKAKNCKYKSYRYLVDTIGEELKKVLGNQVWINSVRASIFDPYYVQAEYSSRYIIIPDIRFIAEQEMLKQLKEDGCKVLYGLILRKKFLPEWTEYGLQPTNSRDLQIIKKDFNFSRPEIEWCTSNPTFDFSIRNDFALDDLETACKRVVNNLL